ncbi:MAG: putative endonuclease [Parasphingorhabdus sp.]|jgi:putative endonuclease
MYQRHKDGAEAEKFAEKHLTKQGLKLIERNFRGKQGEIDLIMQDGETTVFVEVRYRSNKHSVSALESVNRGKQRRIRKTAEYYLQLHQISFIANCRCDVVAIDGNAENIQWIKNAF